MRFLRLSVEDLDPKRDLLEASFDGGDDFFELVDDEVVLGVAEFLQKLDEGFPEAVSAFVEAIENDDGLVLHEGMAFLMENHEGEEFLHGAGAAGEDHEGVRFLNHDFHAGVDVVAEPEGGESFGEAFEFDDVRDVGASGPAIRSY